MAFRLSETDAAGNDCAWYDTFILEESMARVAKRTFSLPPEQAAYIDAKVGGGAYASGSEVVRAGLRALQAQDAAVERWLNEEVGPTYDAMKANPKRSLPAKSVFAEARARYVRRKARR
jgi:antitoxin ParD1/3/4